MDEFHEHLFHVSGVINEQDFGFGLINLETTLETEGFLIGYEPVRFPFFGINSSASGVGYSVAKALASQGFLDEATLEELWAASMAARSLGG